jgi:phage baseplate assembly protein W
MNKEFLGRGWAFPFHFDPATGSVAYSEFEENIRQNIMVIIGTRPGERQMLYDFGCQIHELMFAPSNSSTARLASRYVEEALQRWEPRIEVLQVDSNFDPSGAIMVQVVYRIIATGQVEQLSQVVSS